MQEHFFFLEKYGHLDWIYIHVTVRIIKIKIVCGIHLHILAVFLTIAYFWVFLNFYI